MPKISSKISLSESLTKEFFPKRLNKNEIQSLRRICEDYQRAGARSWTPTRSFVYSSYFGYLTALKFKRAIQELKNRIPMEESSFKIYDYGAGSLGASLGAMDALPQLPTRLTAYDRDPKPMLWAADHFSIFKKVPPKLVRRFPSSGSSPALHLFGNVLTECGLQEESFKPSQPTGILKKIEEKLKKAGPDEFFIFVEPANRRFNENFLTLRDHWSQFNQIILPCTHQKACPAIAQSEWCHEERDYDAPGIFWDIVRQLGFRKKRLNYSFLVLGKSGQIHNKKLARVVSNPLETKGKTELWLCASGKRWKESKLKRHQSSDNEVFFEAERGDILDCSSTGCQIPD